MSQVWGSLNDAAVPILGLFLLRGEDEYFFACHGLREKGNKFQLMYLMFLHNLYMQILCVKKVLDLGHMTMFWMLRFLQL